VVGCSRTIPALTDSALFHGSEPNLDPNLVGTFLHTLPEGGRRSLWPQPSNSTKTMAGDRDHATGNPGRRTQAHTWPGLGRGNHGGKADGEETQDRKVDEKRRYRLTLRTGAPVPQQIPYRQRPIQWLGKPCSPCRAGGSPEGPVGSDRSCRIPSTGVRGIDPPVASRPCPHRRPPLNKCTASW
jgi:hypothetical protein